MKRSTKIYIAGFLLFFIGAVIIQIYIDSLLFLGIGLLYVSFMLIDAKMINVEYESHMEELDKAIKKAKENISLFQKANEPKEETSEDDYFNQKKSDQTK